MSPSQRLTKGRDLLGSFGALPSVSDSSAELGGRWTASFRALLPRVALSPIIPWGRSVGTLVLAQAMIGRR